MHQRFQVRHLVRHELDDRLVAAHLAQAVEDSARVRQHGLRPGATRDAAYSLEERRDHRLELRVEDRRLLLVVVEHLRYALGGSLVLRRGIVEALDERDHLVRLDEKGRYLHLDGVGVRRLVGSGISRGHRVFLIEGG